MTALLARAAQIFSTRSEVAKSLSTDSCARDEMYEYRCNSAHDYQRRLCYFRSDCTWYCEGWVNTGSKC
jgi:hypothetical protein